MTVTVNGAEIFYTMHGNGPACLVPSAMGTAPYERQMAPQLLAHLTMVYVDLRGGGRSTGSAADLTFDRVAEDVDAVRADLGVDRVAVLGHSILGMLALECGRRRPERVSHVITVGTPPSGDMATLSARSAALFEAEADDERKQRATSRSTRSPSGSPPRSPSGCRARGTQPSEIGPVQEHTADNDGGNATRVHDVGERVAVEQHQVCPFAGLDGAELVNQPQEGGRLTGRGGNRLRWREPGLDQELEFPME